MWGRTTNLLHLRSRQPDEPVLVDLASKETKQLTHFPDFDIKFPSLGKDSIVFEQAGYIWRYDLATGQATPVPIELKKILTAVVAGWLMQPSISNGKPRA